MITAKANHQQHLIMLVLIRTSGNTKENQMSDIDILFGAAFLTIMCGAMYTIYRIGFREGSGRMIDFCKSKSKAGLVTILFQGENIEFVDTLEYNKKVLDSIANKLDDASS